MRLKPTMKRHQTQNHIIWRSRKLTSMKNIKRKQKDLKAKKGHQVERIYELENDNNHKNDIKLQERLQQYI